LEALRGRSRREQQASSTRHGNGDPAFHMAMQALTDKISAKDGGLLFEKK
jgi:hypothetical protein